MTAAQAPKVEDKSLNAWLLNFEEPERSLMRSLAQGIRYYSPEIVRDCCRVVYERFKEAAFGKSTLTSDELNAIRFYPIGQHMGSSGVIGYAMQKAAGLPPGLFLTSNPLADVSGLSALVFLDDFVGTGDQAARYIESQLGPARRSLAEREIGIYLLTMVATQKGITRLASCGVSVVVAPDHILEDGDTAFGARQIGRLFASEAECIRARDIAARYGVELVRDMAQDMPGAPEDHALGWKNSSQLVVFYYNVPNNTLPIIWAGPDTGNSSWRPLFARVKTPALRIGTLASMPKYGFLFGREKERKDLRDFLDSGDSGLLFVHGIGGIGKSHLVADVVRERHPVAVYYIPCISGVTSIETIGDVLRIPLQIGSPDNAIEEAVEDYAARIVAVIEQRRCVVLVDDLYNLPADSSVHCLISAGAALRRGKIIAITRAVSAAQSVHPTILVEGLDPLAFADYMRLLHQGLLLNIREDTATVDVVFTLTLGHPLAAALCLWAIANGVRLDELHARLGGVDNARHGELTQRILQVVLERERRAQVSLLEQCAIHRVPIDGDVLSGESEGSFAEDLDALLRKRLMWRTASELISMHPLIRELVRARLAPQRRTELHRSAAQQYAKRYRPITTPSLAEISTHQEAHHHWFEAGDYVQAAGYALSISGLLIEWGRYSMALALLQQTVDTVSGQLQVQVWLMLSQAFGCLENRFDSQRCAEEALSRSRGTTLEAAALSELGLALTHKGSNALGEALRLQTESLRMRQRDGDAHGVGICLHNIGTIHFLERRYEEAAQTFQECLSVKRQSGDDAGLPYTTFQLGVTLLRLRRDAEAFELLATAEEAESRLLRKVDLASTRFELAKLFAEDANHGRAVEMFEHALVDLEHVEEVAALRADMLLALGCEYLNVANYDLAEQRFQEAAECNAALGAELQRAMCLHNLGLVALNRGQLDVAKQLVTEACVVKQKFHKKDGVANAIHTLGRIAAARRDFDEAMRHYGEARALFDELGRKGTSATTLVDIGNVFLEQGRFREALGAYQECLKIKKALGSKHDLALLYVMLGEAYFKSGAGDPARWFKKAADEAIRSGNRRPLAHARFRQFFLFTKRKEVYDAMLALYEAAHLGVVEAPEYESLMELYHGVFSRVAPEDFAIIAADVDGRVRMLFAVSGSIQPRRELSKHPGKKAPK